MFFNVAHSLYSCSGVGQAAGWIYPISTLIEKQLMDIVECNVPVKSANAFFGGLCAPDALQRYYNPFGELIIANYKELRIIFRAWKQTMSL